MRLTYVGFLITLASCSGPISLAEQARPQTTKAGDMTVQDQIKAVNIILDGFHVAASEADGERYFGYFHPEAVFIGTDKNERWPLQEFKEFAEPYFSQGKGWTYVPGERHVMFSEDGLTAWFDEQLVNEKYGHTRGSGALIKVGAKWKVTQYVLSFPIPNEVAGQVVGIVQAHEAKAPGTW